MNDSYKKKIKVFGAALDATDYPMKVLTKCAYLNKLAQKSIDLNSNFLDPYEAFLQFSNEIKKDKYIKLGKIEIESWLTPKPNIEDYPLLHPLRFQEFVNSGAVRDYSKKVEDFVNQNILPDIPLLIGVDHSLTGGVLSALSKKYGKENILTIIFDAHFDAIPSSISLDLAKYASEHQDEIHTLLPGDMESIEPDLTINDTYNCASFIDFLIQSEIILPNNLIIFGCQDYPSKELQSKNDTRVKKYIDYFLSFEKRGVKFIQKEEEIEKMIDALKKYLNESEEKYVYFSFDVDVGIFKEILAARFMNVIGMEKESLCQATSVIKNHLNSEGKKLIGMDILEIETHILNKTMKKSGRTDKTIEVIDEVLRILF